MRVFFDAANGLLLVLMTTTVFARLSALLAKIPVHFDIHGSPDRWDSKMAILMIVGLIPQAPPGEAAGLLGRLHGLHGGHGGRGQLVKGEY